ncbi:MAG: AMP-binding protein [Candidatus Didemnitutus sp.]|nr:AMP-binding protein [Candidatus Didemnitutus sp.]
MERRELAQLLGATASAAVPAQRPLLAETDERAFRTAFATVVAGDGELFLGNPAWTDAEHAALAALWEANPREATNAEEGWLMIPTGGSSGKIKFARHDSHTLAAAVRAFGQHFGLARVNAVGGLPLFHVSGLVGWLRTVLTGGDYWPVDWKLIEHGERPALPSRADGWVMSLVPTQLERLLRTADGAAWLRSFRVVLLGGAPASAALLDRAAAAEIPLAPSYGMTETAAMVTALRPKEFLAGTRSAGAPLPHARVEIDQNGVIGITAESNFRGYYPARRGRGGLFVTADGGRLDERGHLHVGGRRDAAIITGGEKVHPAEVEAVLKAATPTEDLAVVGVPDAEWGERVVCVFAAGGGVEVTELRRAATEHLAPAQRPKAYVALDVWPRMAAGKLSRPALVEAAERALRTGARDVAG